MCKVYQYVNSKMIFEAFLQYLISFFKFLRVICHFKFSWLLKCCLRICEYINFYICVCVYCIYIAVLTGGHNSHLSGPGWLLGQFGVRNSILAYNSYNFCQEYASNVVCYTRTSNACPIPNQSCQNDPKNCNPFTLKLTKFVVPFSLQTDL